MRKIFMNKIFVNTRRGTERTNVLSVLCATSVFSVSLCLRVESLLSIIHHRGTENTTDAQRLDPNEETLETVISRLYCPASIFAGFMSSGMNCRSIKSFMAIGLSKIPALTAMSLICCKSSSVGVSIR